MTTSIRTLVFESGTSFGTGPKLLGPNPTIRVPEKIPYIWVLHFGILPPWVIVKVWSHRNLLQKRFKMRKLGCDQPEMISPPLIYFIQKTAPAWCQNQKVAFWNILCSMKNKLNNVGTFFEWALISSRRDLSNNKKNCTPLGAILI